MPYSIIKRDDKFCVIREKYGNRPQETKKCYSQKSDAEKYLSALRMHGSGDTKTMSVRTIQPIAFKSVAYKSGLWSRIVGMAKQVRFGHYQDYSIYYYNTAAVIAQINSNLVAGAGQDVFIDALNGLKAADNEISVFNNSYGVSKDIQSTYSSLLSAYKTSSKAAAAGLRMLITPSNAGGVGLGGGKSTAKVKEVQSNLNGAASALNKIGAMFKSFYKDKLGADDYVHTDANARTQADLDEAISSLKDELIDVYSNMRSFSRLPFVFRTETEIEYHTVPKTSTERIAKKQPRGEDDLYDRYSVDEIHETTHNDVVAVPKQVHVIDHGSRQYAIGEEAETFVSFYNKWYSNFYRQFKIYSKPIGAVQGLITPIIDDFEYFTSTHQYSTDEKAFDQATNILINQISKVLKVLGQIKLE